MSVAADRIHALIDGARHSAASAGKAFDLQEVFVRALVRCGLSPQDARDTLSDPNHDPISRILHFAGESHNFAILAVEEALAAA